MAGNNSAKEEENQHSSMRLAEAALRLAAAALSIASLTIMLRNSENNDFGYIAYSNLTAFKYLVHANGICAAYSLLSAIVIALPRRTTTMSRLCTFFLLDQLLTYIMLAGGAVSTEILLLAYNGDSAVTWSKACGSFPGFCHRGVMAVAITFGAVACLVGLSILSSYRLFSRFDAPALEFHG